MNPYESPRELVDEDAAPALPGVRILYDGQFLLADLVAAIRLSQRGAVQTLRSLVSMAALPLVIVCWIALLWLQQPRLDFRLLALLIGGGVLGSALMIARQVALPWLTAWRVQAGCSHMLARGEVNNEGIVVAEPTSTTALSWQAFEGYRTNDDVLLLFTRFPQNYVILIRRAFKSAGDWEGAMALVSTALPER
jgi:hypothetical protein